MKYDEYLRPAADDFSFEEPYLSMAKAEIAKYPERRKQSAVIALMDLAQRQNKTERRVSPAAAETIADMLNMSKMRALEVLSFYSMLRDAPVGKYLLQVCGTTSCQLCGAEDILSALEKETGAKKGETSADGNFTIIEVECLGACVNAPMIQVNDHYYEDLTPQSAIDLAQALKKDAPPPPGSMSGRRSSEPAFDVKSKVTE